MSEYHTEGFVKEIIIMDGKVTFKLEPTAPYIFEKKIDDGSVVRMLLLVDDDMAVAKLVDVKHSFVGPQAVDYNSLVIAKANRLKVVLTVDRVKKESSTIEVTSICIL